LAPKKTKKTKPLRKLRTREHIIEELSINHFQREALLCGFSIEIIKYDYGYDLLLFTYASNGEIENGSVSIQMKASDHVEFNKKDCIHFDVDTKDLNLWLNQFDPVLLVMYDAIKGKAYWLDVQEYFKSITLTKRNKKQQSYRVHIPRKNKLNMQAMRMFAKLKNDKYINITNQFS